MRRLLPGSKQKKVSLDPRNRQGTHQKHLPKPKRKIHSQQRWNLFLNHRLKGGGSSSQTRTNKQYSFKDEHVDSLFKLLNKSNKLKLPEARRPDEVDKTDNPSYCLYHRMLGTLLRTATSSKISSRLWLMRKSLSFAQSKRRWRLTWRHFFSLKNSHQNQ